MLLALLRENPSCNQQFYKQEGKEGSLNYIDIAPDRLVNMHLGFQVTLIQKVKKDSCFGRVIMLALIL
ncbi:hypothetical protein EUGRSUZ_E00012 [Eucalyptus grandis]|uniref:Uncharacterized protein n=2 Tax=Eucalyptus grandis TaxID=71139 RepID=A0ACC3KQ42_EUCGR|nr:hypothetical protein EUGRSUZ_E00012 [Eucalyptus grandis]